MCLIPPSVTREVHFLVLSVYGAEGMPAMDDPELFGAVKPGIDAFVEVQVRKDNSETSSITILSNTGCAVGPDNSLLATPSCGRSTTP